MAREQRLVPIIGTAHTDTESSPSFKLTPKGRAAIDDLDEQLEDCADESSEDAREFAVFANHDTVGKQARLITELHAKLDEQAIIIRELVASERMSLTAIQGLTTERDGALAQSAGLLATALRLETAMRSALQVLDKQTESYADFNGNRFLYDQLCAVIATLTGALTEKST